MEASYSPTRFHLSRESLNPEGYAYPQRRGQVYGQTFTCISVNKDDLTKQLGDLLDHMQIMKPDVYYSHVHTGASEILKNKISELIKKKNLPRPFEPENRSFLFGSSNLIQLHIAGRSEWDGAKDFFSTLANMEGHRTSLYAQTWKDRQNPFDSECKETFTVENVKKISIEYQVWERTQDHSKWAVSKSDAVPLVCIGDLNRAPSTMARGGIFICSMHQRVYDFFKWIPEEKEECSAQTIQVKSINETTAGNSSSLCLADQFECTNGKCISSQFYCDADDDCGDFSDERFCSVWCLRNNLFTCHDNFGCIGKEKVCDGVKDCGDGSDEIGSLCSINPTKKSQNETTTAAPPQVLPNECHVPMMSCGMASIPGNWRCDGDPDCVHGEDELNCDRTSTKSDGDRFLDCDSVCASGIVGTHNECVTACCKANGYKDKGGHCREGDLAYCGVR